MTKSKRDIIKEAQALALSTYKNPDLPVDFRLNKALQILKDTGEDLIETKNQETLGLAGAIYKRKWEVDGLKQHLERSLAYYRRGYNEGVENDQGYTGINAAFILDMLADLEEREAKKAGTTSETAAGRQRDATSIRKDIVNKIPNLPNITGKEYLKTKWWFWVTIAEAYFGLKQYDEALRYLKIAEDLTDPISWESESTARQLAYLARLQDEGSLKPDSKPRNVLYEFFNGNSDAVDSVFTGKIGLALSGGGFRASLFHIGVLAKLAEMDFLRKVEVISCISGGSIIGAHYYLEIQHLLETKHDSAITKQDYIDIVKRIEEDFLKGVQKNIRTKAFANPLKNFKMLSNQQYSRTIRIGDLYETELFSKVRDGKGNDDRWLDDLKINPFNDSPDFAPKHHNWRRAAKAPIIIFNATSLNTGHNWQFTATWMGEPPIDINTEVDSNYRLRRMYYDDAPEPYKRIRLGHAVAASACVPGLFEPYTLDGLYPNKVVQLVDGGTHDNQGTASLLEQGCTTILVSDASGQMNTDDVPNNNFFSVPLRANNILMARVREAQYKELGALQKSSRLKGLLYIHLKQDLGIEDINWVGCKNPYVKTTNSKKVTCYGINRKYQECLAGMRTDLDSFSDVEAYSLMASGYLLTEHYFPKRIDNFSKSAMQREDWKFLNIEIELKQEDCSDNILKQLAIASQRTFKIWRLSNPLKLISAILCLSAISALIIFKDSWWSRVVFTMTLGMSATFIIALIVNQLFGSNIMKFIGYRKTIKDIGIAMIMCILGWPIALLHLRLFDKLFLYQGRVK